MSASNLCQVVTGRVLEIDVRAGYRCVADVDDMLRRIKQQFASVPVQTRIVIAADWRAEELFKFGFQRQTPKGCQ